VKTAILVLLFASMALGQTIVLAEKPFPANERGAKELQK